MQSLRICHICHILKSVAWTIGIVFLCMSIGVQRAVAHEICDENSSGSLVCANSLENNPTKSLYFDIKTNLLYDALAVPNIGVEFYVGKGFSVSAGWMYAWWSRESRHRLWRIYGGEVEGRWWFGNKSRLKPLTGHHIGLYAGMFTFCFEFGHKGYLGGLPGENLWNRAWINAGVEYGYSLPLTSRLNMDFSIGIGWIGGKMEKYEAQGESHAWQSTVRQSWIGPAKAEISLVWLLGRENRNISKSRH